MRRIGRRQVGAWLVLLAACTSGCSSGDHADQGADEGADEVEATTPAESSPTDPTPATPGRPDSSPVPTTGSSAATIVSAPPRPEASDTSAAGETAPGATTPPTPASTAAGIAADIAADITAAERGIRDLTLTPAEVAAHGRRQQRAYRALARHPELHDQVTAAIPDDVAVAYGFNTMARQAVVDHAAGRPPSEPPATLPAWTIVEPRPIDELLGYYEEAERATGVPWEYLAAINFVETRMGRIVGASSAGALGPMQFLPTTWAACCTGDITDPHDAIIGAARYLVVEGAPADMQAALHGYNPNAGYVGAVTAYAANLMADPLAYRGYHAWEVYVGSSAGTVRLPIGYSSDVPVDAAEYVRTHPEDLL